MSVLVECHDLVYVYGSAGAEVAALRGLDLQLDAGESVALLGPSGSGKTTLLWHLAGLLRPVVGSVRVAGTDLAALDARRLTEFRHATIGVLLQGPASNLLPYDTAVGNLRWAGADRARAHHLLEAVGLAAVARRRAGRLSGGEMQRLALAVALANSPRLLLADEPTSQLDPASARAVLDLIGAATADGTTVLAVTHDPAVAAAVGRTVSIRDGRVTSSGVAGAEHLVIGRDGSVLLPAEVLANLPPGTRLSATLRPDGVDLRREP